MSRRVSLPGASELFRSTSPLAEAEPAELGPAISGAPEGERDHAPAPAESPPGEEFVGAARRRPRPVGDRRPTGRERHEEKITVYCSPDELIDLERSRLALRGDFGIAVDRGRIVREALSLVLSELESKGEQSTLVRRLRGR
ncbi:MAG: hypothetical protein ABR520_00195 [Mycobacteriales bacterium]|nr:hypothetical protein [Frankia sp.]